MPLSKTSEKPVSEISVSTHQLAVWAVHCWKVSRPSPADRQKVLAHHPDKQQQQAEGDGEGDDHFKCIKIGTITVRHLTFTSGCNVRYLSSSS